MRYKRVQRFRSRTKLPGIFQYRWIFSVFIRSAIRRSGIPGLSGHFCGAIQYANHSVRHLFSLNKHCASLIFCLTMLSACGPSITADIKDSAAISKDPQKERELWNPELSQLPTSQAHQSSIVALIPMNQQKPLEPGESSFNRLASVGSAGEVLVWDLATEQARILTQLGSGVSTAILSGHQRDIAWISAGRVRLRSLSDESGDMQPEILTRAVSLAFQPNADVILIGGADGRIYRWKYGAQQRVDLSLRERAKLIERYIGHPSVVSALAYHPFGRVFFSGDWLGGLSAWLPYDADEYQGKYDVNIFGGTFFTDSARRVKAGRAAVSSIERMIIDPTGEYLTLASQDGDLELWRVRGFYSRATMLKAHKGRVDALAFEPQSRQIASYGRDKLLRIWTVETDEEQSQKLGLQRQENLRKVAEARLPGLKELVFLNSNELIAGTSEGKLLVINIDQLTKS